MKTLVMGGRSALAQTLVPALADDGAVLTAGRSGCDLEFDLRSIRGDFRFPAGIDTLVHTAAHFGGRSEAEKEKAWAVNVEGTRRLCHTVADSGIGHFVLVSSMSARLPEDSPYNGIYARTKRESEKAAAQACRERGIALTVLRPSQLYGIQNDFRRNQPLIYAMMDMAREGRDITIYGTHDARRNYLYADDFCALIRKVLAEKIEGDFDCCFPEDVRISEVARAAVGAFGSASRIRFLEDREDIPDNVFGNDRTLFEKAAYTPRVNVKEGLQRIAAQRGRKA